jgi:hypothetical protein
MLINGSFAEMEEDANGRDEGRDVGNVVVTACETLTAAGELTVDLYSASQSRGDAKDIRRKGTNGVVVSRGCFASEAEDEFFREVLVRSLWSYEDDPRGQENGEERKVENGAHMRRDGREKSKGNERTNEEDDDQF